LINKNHFLNDTFNIKLIILKLLIVIFLIIGNVSAMAAQEVFDEGVKLGVDAGGYFYSEPGNMNIRGEMAGFGISATKRIGKIALSIEGDYKSGSGTYSGGSLSLKTPSEKLDTRILVGGEIELLANHSTVIYAGLAQRTLANRLKDDGIIGGYRRINSLKYLPIGLMSGTDMRGIGKIILNIEYDYFLRGNQASLLGSDMGTGYENINSRQKKGQGIRASIMGVFDHFSVGPYIESWSIKDSEITKDSFGRYWYEPKSYTFEVGLKAKFTF